MVFPGEMIINIDRKEFSYVTLLRGLPPKEREMLQLNFLRLGLKITLSVFFILTESFLHFGQTSIFWSSSLRILSNLGLSENKRYWCHQRKADVC